MNNNLVIASLNLEAVYAEMALDKVREADALEWAELTIGDATEEILESTPFFPD